MESKYKLPEVGKIYYYGPHREGGVCVEKITKHRDFYYEGYMVEYFHLACNSKDYCLDHAFFNYYHQKDSK